MCVFFLSCVAGLGQPQSVVLLHPPGAHRAGGEEVADHPRAGGGGVEGAARPEGQPLPGVPLWTAAAHPVQGQRLRGVSLYLLL